MPESPQSTRPVRPLASGAVVELRVHGVSGTPATELLDRPLVDLVAGDATAGFYRPRLEAESHDDFPAGASEPEVAGPTLEGYVWGGLTSGAPSRALWLLLLPFTLGNVAPRLRPGACGPRRVRLIWYLSRLLALTLTIVLVAAFVGIGVDLVGWQCGPQAHRCGGASPGWLMDPILRMGTARRVLVGSLVPVLGLGFLWLLSERTVRKYEKTPVRLSGDHRERTAHDDDPADAVEVTLESRWMWQSTEAVRRLRGLHMQVGFAATLAMVGAATHGVWQWLDGLLAIAVLGYAMFVLTRQSFGSRLPVGRWQDIGYGIWGALLVGGIGTAIWLLRCDSLPPDPVHCSGSPSNRLCVPAGLPHYAETLVWLLLVELLLVLALAAIVIRKQQASGAILGERGPSFGIHGMGAAVMSLLAVFLAAVFTSGAYLIGAAWLATGSWRPKLTVVTDVSRTFAVPEAISDAGLAYSLAVGMLLAFLLVFGTKLAWVWLRINVNSWLLVPRSFLTDYPTAPTSPKNTRTKTLLRARWTGRIVDLAGGVLGVITLLGALLTYVFGVLLLLEHTVHVSGPARWLLDPVGRGDLAHLGVHARFFSRVGLQGKGAYLAVWTLVLMVLLGGLAFRVAKTRRSVGILWDLASFWPRLCHPLAAPCYAERTVPELVGRIRWHVGDGRPVVLAGHSQGTVISAATISQLRLADELERDRASVAGDTAATNLPNVALLTFGCVLRRLYGRFFPAYFGPATLRRVGDAVADGATARWWNLWRYTDYLGGPVLSGPPPTLQQVWDPSQQLPAPPDPATATPCVDLHLRDPEFKPAPGDTADPPPLRHSDFWKVREFQQAVAALAGMLESAPALQEAGRDAGPS